MARSHTLSFLIVPLALTGLLAIACDSGTQEPAAPTTPTSPTSEALQVEDSAGMNASPDEMTESGFPASRYPADLPEGVQATIPDTFPEEFPLYPGSAPAQGRGVDLKGVPTAALQLLTMDPPEQVYEYYVENLQGEGWEIDDREDFRGKNAISASNGKCRASMLVTPTEDGGSDIFLITEC